MKTTEPIDRIDQERLQHRWDHRDADMLRGAEIDMVVRELLDRRASDDAHCGHCAKCRPQFGGMIVCVTCGNKRCPHATDCALACTNSNAPNQKGSSYEHLIPHAPVDDCRRIASCEFVPADRVDWWYRDATSQLVYHGKSLFARHGLTWLETGGPAIDTRILRGWTRAKHYSDERWEVIQ